MTTINKMYYGTNQEGKKISFFVTRINDKSVFYKLNGANDIMEFRMSRKSFDKLNPNS
jgi:hypothetical protein